jgi:lipoprotein-releasing system ATP-binding protein
MLQANMITKDYPGPRGPVRVLSEISLSLERGESAAVVGPSGSGKSTLLYILGTLERPTSGSVLVDGCDPGRLSDSRLAAFRNQKIGFVFQDHCLLPQCSALENVLVPTLVSGANKSHRARAHELLERVGLGDRVQARPGELSGGEQQRVALARALIREPVLLLCDEPTGNLDAESTESVATLLFEGAGQRATLVVTHNRELAEKFPIRLELRHAALHHALS